MISFTASKISDLPGLTSAKRAVLRFANPESGVHAVLLYGAEGAGKSALADALAQAWLCTNPSEEGACGKCKTCEAFERNRAADVLRVNPRGPSDIIKQNAVNYVENDPDPDPPIPMIDFFRTPPLAARNKVAIISRADRMNKSAANAFLKTLEEPQPRVKIAITTSEIGLVLPTIVSRCVCVACELPPQESIKVPKDVLPELIELAEGSPGRLDHILAHADAYARIVKFARKFVSSPASHALALSEEFRNICDDLEDALDLNARAANVEGLRAFGASLSSLTDRDDWFVAIAEAHRRVQGNGNDGLAVDAAFAKALLARD